MAGSDIFAIAMKMCLKTLYALFNLIYIYNFLTSDMESWGGQWALYYNDIR